MDAEFLEKLLSHETSAEEREMLCEIAYGMSFSECVGEIRHDDFVTGLNDGRYNILSISLDGEKRDYLEIRFICYMGFEKIMHFLYQSEERHIEPNAFTLDDRLLFTEYARGPIEYYVRFHKTEIDDVMLTALRKWADIYGISLCLPDKSVKTQKSPEIAQV